MNPDIVFCQTEKAMEMVSSDLAEFTSTMQKDTKTVVEKTKETLQVRPCRSALYDTTWLRQLWIMYMKCQT